MRNGRRLWVAVLVGMGVAAAGCTSPGHHSGAPGPRPTTADQTASSSLSEAPTITPKTVITPPNTTALAVSAALPVVECPTTYGGGRPGYGPPLSTSISLPIPPASAAQLSFYSNEDRTLSPVMGPRGWSCNVQVGADGTIGVDLYPGSAPSSSELHLPAVDAVYDSACQGCVYSTVCAFVPDAAQQLGYTNSGIGCAARPPGETVDWLSGTPSGTGTIHDVIGFSDPASPNATNGVVLYAYPTTEGGGSASEETCTLPASEHVVCTRLLDDFIGRSWPR